ncbi:hypothetical protein NC651_013240 [Populus alba x Populus x berolinensis]|nr:hypothetical protein NC651_013240 [Populus alba x Populus x berolinensis]
MSWGMKFKVKNFTVSQPSMTCFQSIYHKLQIKALDLFSASFYSAIGY